MSSKVYFSKDITPESVLRLVQLCDGKLSGRVAVKVHSGERGNQNFIRPDFWRPVVESVKGTVVECNTAYEGARNTTERHLALLSYHGWDEYFDTEILDGEGPDLCLKMPNGMRIRENYVGRGIEKYDSALVLSHFKGHPMGGFGGAIKQLSIGFASSYGKKYIHGAGEVAKVWSQEQTYFLESMADAALSVTEYFGGRILYVNVMKNMSVDCDCCAVAEDPCIADIGVLVSEDPVAIDRASVDLVYASSDPGRPHLIERIESRKGTYTLDCAEKLGIGSNDYELICVD